MLFNIKSRQAHKREELQHTIGPLGEVIRPTNGCVATIRSLPEDENQMADSLFASAVVCIQNVVAGQYQLRSGAQRLLAISENVSKVTSALLVNAGQSTKIA